MNITNAWCKVKGVMGERRVSHKHKGNVLRSCVTQAYMNALDATPLTKKQGPGLRENKPGKNNR